MLSVFLPHGRITRAVAPVSTMRCRLDHTAARPHAGGYERNVHTSVIKNTGRADHTLVPDQRCNPLIYAHAACDMPAAVEQSSGVLAAPSVALTIRSSSTRSR